MPISPRHLATLVMLPGLAPIPVFAAPPFATDDARIVADGGFRLLF